jgi:hypothetical protein
VPDEYRRDSFLTGKAAAEARRQEGIREAHEVFGKAHLVEKARHAAAYERASARWDAIKMNAKSERYEVAWRAFQLAKQPPNHNKARGELDRAIKAADEAYHAELACLGRSTALEFLERQETMAGL